MDFNHEWDHAINISYLFFPCIPDTVHRSVLLI